MLLILIYHLMIPQVFIRTANNVLIEINPATRIPRLLVSASMKWPLWWSMIFCRTFKRFAGLMVQLLHKYHITAADSNVKLIKVIGNLKISLCMFALRWLRTQSPTTFLLVSLLCSILIVVPAFMIKQRRMEKLELRILSSFDDHRKDLYEH